MPSDIGCLDVVPLLEDWEGASSRPPHEFRAVCRQFGELTASPSSAVGMYGPRMTARVEWRARVSLRKCWGFSWECVSGHDDDAHVPVLISPSVTEHQLNSQVLRQVVGLFLSRSLLDRLWWAWSPPPPSGGKVENVLSLPGPDLRSACRLVLINLAAEPRAQAMVRSYWRWRR